MKRNTKNCVSVEKEGLLGDGGGYMSLMPGMVHKDKINSGCVKGISNFTLLPPHESAAMLQVFSEGNGCGRRNNLGSQ